MPLSISIALSIPIFPLYTGWAWLDFYTLGCHSAYRILPYIRPGVYFFQGTAYQAFIWDRHLFAHRHYFLDIVRHRTNTCCTFCPPPFNCFLLDHPLFFCSSSFSFCLHYSLMHFGSTSNSLATACLVLFSEKWIALNLKARANYWCHSFFAMTEHVFTLRCHV